MNIFRSDAGPAVYNALLGFDAATTTPPVKTTIFALARLYAWIASVVHLFLEEDCRKGRRKKEYPDASEQFPRSTTIELADAVCQLAEYWYPEELEADTYSTSVKLRKKFFFALCRSAKRIVSLPSLSKMFLATRPCWLHTFVSRKLGRNHDCYFAQLADKFKSVIRLGSDGPYSLLPPPAVEHFIQ